MKQKLIWCGMGLLALSACGKAPAGNVSGTYVGTESGYQNGSAFSAQISVTIVQSGSDVSGTWSSSAGTSGDVSGTYTGGSFEPLKISQTQPCQGTASGSVKSEGDTLSGAVYGNSSDCGTWNAQIDLKKQ